LGILEGVMKIRIALREHGKGLNNLSFLLLANPSNLKGIEIVGIFNTDEDAINGIPVLKPDVVLVDLNGIGISGIEVIRKLKSRLPRIKILVLSMHEDRKHLFSALRAGAGGYLLKNSTPEEIVEAIKEIHRGNSPMSPKVMRYVIEFFHKIGMGDGVDSLTEREKDILRGIVDGLTARECAERLRLSHHTVRTHIKNIYKKLQVHSRVEAVMRVKEKRIL